MQVGDLVRNHFSGRVGIVITARTRCSGYWNEVLVLSGTIQKWYRADAFEVLV